MDLQTRTSLVIKSAIPSGQVTWQSPSNIALIKYWGKFGIQLPKNPSLSFTLTKAFTETTLRYRPKTDPNQRVSMCFQLDGVPHAAFEVRLKTYLESLLTIFPFLDQLHLDVFSKNSFPHSAGIASSASAMSAMALCLSTIEHQLFDTLADDQQYEQQASYIARLGSGSASRSVFKKAALWGQTGLVKGASNEYAVPFEQNLHEVFHTYQDAILLVDQGAKPVSSSTGHALMDNHPFATTRYEQAKSNLHRLMDCLRTGDLKGFGNIVEIEALQLHALMMCSKPYYILMKPNTLKIIDLVQEFRKSTSVPVCFTLDAGPNIHLLYPKSQKDTIHQFINEVLAPYCHNGSWIDDEVGDGPFQID